ncbi:uncharacterized protein [Watersipora subatra]|uniref:uncharacterized protein n=1 Tax=Watersipora subatra TaxID=2589382 RepID=UPI00355BD3A0
MTFEMSDATCLYGDKNLEFCSQNADCSLSVIRSLCCGTCSDYQIPDDVNAVYQLKINVTSLRCTVGLNDRDGQEYAIFKFDIEQAVNDILLDIPGAQLSELTDITCGSVLAILEIRSSGFYDLVEMNTIIMMALSVGTLRGIETSYSVSVTGSSLRALSFEAPRCVSDSFSLNCLTDFVLTEPSKCYEEQVLSQCCLSCSSLFYARLAAAAADMGSCPYGNQDVECFTSPLIDCSNEDARARCCDRCAGVSTTPLPTTTTTEPTTTSTTPEPCIDDETDLCLQAVQNSLTFCYTEKEKCCATCESRKIGYLPDECAWGNQDTSQILERSIVQHQIAETVGYEFINGEHLRTHSRHENEVNDLEVTRGVLFVPSEFLRQVF